MPKVLNKNATSISKSRFLCLMVVWSRAETSECQENIFKIFAARVVSWNFQARRSVWFRPSLFRLIQIDIQGFILFYGQDVLYLYYLRPGWKWKTEAF
ncbi:hypothetical protein CSA56_11075 [candidate division KSB3 bacterium]|uniref:Uncharacterized protein n=1 Tax=candidate division KSB3 bacterium TaxID=2044937 RepID=A0A2G6KFQ9_9BACT|nr:MAG: hypothetical protein CSA56_11075 [candidate division KSB3 bacterium]